MCRSCLFRWVAGETHMHHFDAAAGGRRVARRLIALASTHFSKCICVSPAPGPGVRRVRRDLSSRSAPLSGCARDRAHARTSEGGGARSESVVRSRRRPRRAFVRDPQSRRPGRAGPCRWVPASRLGEGRRSRHVFLPAPSRSRSRRPTCGTRPRAPPGLTPSRLAAHPPRRVPAPVGGGCRRGSKGQKAGPARVTSIGVI